MPGLYGIVDFDAKPDPSLFERLGKVISPKDGKSHLWTSENISLGFKSLGLVDFEDQPFVEDSLTLFFWGEVFSPPSLNSNILKHIVSLYKENQLVGLKDINGFFSFALWDNKRQALILACDIHDTRPLFYSQQSNGIVFGPNPFVIANALGNTEIDEIALHQFLVFSTIFEDHTWIKNVKKLRYGQYLKFNDSGVNITQYFQPTRNVKKMTLDKAADNALTLLSQSVKSMAKGKTAISLSGGGDSRLIAAVCRQNDIPIPAFTYGSDISEDSRIAEEVAGTLDIRHYPLLISDDFLKSNLRRAVYNTGGYVSAVNFHGISTRSDVKLFCDICLSGLYGNNYLGYLSFNQLKFMTCTSEKAFNRKLFEWLIPGGLYPAVNFSSAEEVIRSTIRNLAKIYRQKTCFETMMMIDHFEINAQRSMAGTWLENDTLEFRSPYCNPELLKFNMTVPAKYLRLMRVGRKIWQKHFPELGKIEYQRTGLPLAASIPKVLIRKLAHRSGKDNNLPGIMDYDYIIRQKMKKWITFFLTSKDSLIGKYIQPKSLDQVIDDFHVPKMAALLVIEQVLRILNNKP